MPGRVFFTSDQHFGHARIIEYCNRPFADVHDMNKQLTERFNDTVGEGDLTYHLGDFAFDRDPRKYLQRLNGAHILVAGNHDACHIRRSRYLKSVRMYEKAGFWEVHPYWISMTIESLGEVLLTHMPPSFFEPDRYAEWRMNDWTGRRIHGHVHEKWKSRKNHVNVGVDQWNFAPITLEQVVDEMKAND